MHLARHFEIVGGDKAVIEASDALGKALLNILQSSGKVLVSEAGPRRFPITTYPKLILRTLI